jgi:predicted DNA binding protein
MSDQNDSYSKSDEKHGVADTNRATLTAAEREAILTAADAAREIERLQRSATDWRLEAEVHRKRAAAAVAEIARLRLTDEEREAIELAISKRLDLDAIYTLRNLLARLA